MTAIRADARATLRPGGGWEPFPEAALRGSIVDRFATIVERHGARPAVDDGIESLDYGTLGRRTASVAAAVSAAGDPGGRPPAVAILIDQGTDFVVGFVGGLRTGAMVVPLDPALPDVVLGDLISHSDVSVIVGHGPTVSAARRIAAHRNVVDIDTLPPDATWSDPMIDPAMPATLFYTSGSTGRPKGVVDSHANVLDNIRRYADSLAIGPDDRLGLIHGPMFSGLVSSLLGGLLTGATVLPFDLRRDGLDGLARRIETSGMTMLHCVPSILRGLVHARRVFPEIRVVRLEGDLATWSDVDAFRRWFGTGATLVNGLGATETGLTRQFFVGASEPPARRGPLPIGYPVAGVTVDLRALSGEATGVGPGEIGRIVVRGRHLALGYWRDQERTSEAFAPDPADPAVRTFLSGDLGRMDADGCLVHVGRFDDVAKVRGMTVDPTVVEAALLALPGVGEAVAIVRSADDGDGRLIGYVVPEDGATLDPMALRRDLDGVLSSEYIPSAIVTLPSLPTTATGKVDRSALPTPGRTRPPMKRPYRPPGDPLEERLVQAWSAVLDVRPIGVDDPFFDLGGDSLSAETMLLEVSASLGLDVPRQILGRATTVAELAAELRRPGVLIDDGDELVTLTVGSGPAIFAIHAAVAQPMLFRSVAQALGHGITFHSLGPTDPSHDRRYGSIDALADHYVERIRSERADGPYHLVGFCYGGVVAHRVAQVLRAQGADVSSLTLLGVGPREFPTLISPEVRRRYGRSRAADRLRSVKAAIQVHGVPTGLSMAMWRSFGVVRRSVFRRSARRQGGLPRGPIRDDAPVRDVIVSNHRATPYKGRLVVVLGRDARPSYLRDAERELSGLANDGVSVVMLPGDEHAMLTSPVSDDLARVLRSQLTGDRAGAHPAP